MHRPGGAWCLSGFLTLPCEGEVANGDAVVVRDEGPAVLLAVVDALGHGPVAGAVASTATRVLQATPLDGVLRIVERLHEELRGTRGAEALICLRAGDRVEACRIGDVELRCAHARWPRVSTQGVLGGDLRRLRAFGGPLRCPERIVIHSDGVSGRFELDDLAALPPSEACQAIMSRHRRPYDDASVLVADLRRAAAADPAP